MSVNQIEPQIEIPNSCQIHPLACIGKNVHFGENVIVHPFAVIGDNVQLQDNVEVFSGALIGKEPKGCGALSRKPEFIKKITIGQNCSIGPHSIIYYDVEIGQNTLIGDGASIREQCRIGAYCILSRYVTLNYNVTIGDRTKVMDMTHVTGNCVIGEDVFISLHVGMANDNRIGKDGFHEEIKGPEIKDRAVIGLGSMLLPNIVIGEEAVISAGSIVRKSVPPKAFVAGNPGKILKKIG